MNAQDWQATAEVIGVILIALNAIFAGVMYRMQAKFVTRAEHHAVASRVDDVEVKIGAINQTIAGLFTAKEAKDLYEKIGAVQTQNAQLLGELPGLRTTIGQFNHQLNMLIKNEIDGKGGRS